MAIRFLVFFQVFIIYSTSLLTILPQNSCNASNTPKLEQCGFNATYNLGTSISDTGNSAVDNPSTWQAKFPYGETIHEATGRPSDGLLIIDYIVVQEALAKKNIALELTNPSLDVQLGWLDDYFEGFCHNVKEDCTKALSSSLFMMNFGTNDYGSAFRQNHSMEEIKKNNLVSDVVEARKQALKKIISRGARKVLLGVALDGCRPISLAMQSANKSATYDRFGCVKDSNDFCKYHNEVLQEGLTELREQHPDVQIVYGDLYNAMQSVFDNFKSLGECFFPFIHNDV
ncbi:ACETYLAJMALAN ESTERASE-LIKE [Salix koriyanagi]|uniref:ACETYLAJMALAN ESTERASE-LIKE n=1 Tax=Salix koriyanagi TaxID=2511006 RepID=A0A9Q0Q600_9ROSI|nr:ACETYLAJMALAN ESTERASE-LIKE [Salix koriyanagi]